MSHLAQFLRYIWHMLARDFFQSALNQNVTVSKFRNLEYENFRIMFYTSFGLVKLEE